MKKNKNIESLFQDAFSGYQEEINPEEMELMWQYTEKKAFYKFSLSRFNIYYAMMICSCFFLSGYSAINYFLAKDNIPSVVIKTEERLPEKTITEKKNEVNLTGKDNQKIKPKEQESALARKNKENASTSPSATKLSITKPAVVVISPNKESIQISESMNQDAGQTTKAKNQKFGHVNQDMDTLDQKISKFTHDNSPAISSTLEDTIQKNDPVIIIVQDTIYKVDTVRSRLFSIFKRD